ncbi:site-specific integrase [Spiribacter sp. 218]|uniref:tyrosine-type recombinase/integrase n=1 Tax=Spiribacter pallidus TaxID=1987936 RepID=UPI00349F4B8B
MPIKNKPDGESEISIFDEAVIYKRGDYWQFRMWLNKEGRYLRQSLKTKKVATAKDLAQKIFYRIKHDEEVGRRQFSKTAKQGVEEYLQSRCEDVEIGVIKKGRYGTIKTHLTHWLDFIGRDEKLRDLRQLDCEGYVSFRVKNNKNYSVSKSTIANEQSTINAMVGWLYRKKEVEIPRFEFQKVAKRKDAKDTVERSVFTIEELSALEEILLSLIAESKKDLTNQKNIRKLVACYYLYISMQTGLRRGEALQLTWWDIEFKELQVRYGYFDKALPIAPQIARLKINASRESSKSNSKKAIRGDVDCVQDTVEYANVTVREDTTKVKSERTFIAPAEPFLELQNAQLSLSLEKNNSTEVERPTTKTLIFSTVAGKHLSYRAIAYWFSYVIHQAKIENLDKRNIVPYSFRHTYITNRVNANHPPMAIAEDCGTSLEQITNTYYHTTDRKRIANAFPDSYFDGSALYPYDH